ncbi:hypothetical protein F8388_006040 [Cannabis sativa]|uniref:Uncharacterized protein n=1 Tax=Cannabis sativa TaxID=3483 RepID=A0A7J6H5K2_CANSA|nr:hypothetical protein F8388_006040 [Cannabis sativa]
MKIKNKGKVYPSPNSSSSSSSSSNDTEILSVLKLLPAAILALASVLSLEDKEVLAYMITRSMKTSSSSSSSSSLVTKESKKKSSKKGSGNNNNNNNNNNNSNNIGHKPPMFDCDCFDCYTSYWFRWDSSPNRELIHQVIEAFEDHLSHGEKSKNNNNNNNNNNSGRGKRRDKLGRRDHHQLVQSPLVLPDVPPPQPTLLPVPEENSHGSQSPLCVVVDAPATKNEKFEDEIQNGAVEGEQQLTEVSDDVAVSVRTMTTANDHKGLARKVLPDVLGLLNSRLWSLWSPNA